MKPSSFSAHSQNQLIGIVQAATMLGVSPVTVRRRVHDRSLPHIRINSRLYFKMNELQAYIEKHRGALAY
jgi:excisionase family DNA binding protein